MEILDAKLKKYYDAMFYLKEILKKTNSKFIKSAYIYGSFTRNEIIPDISDLDVMFFVDRNELSKENLEMISNINESVLEKYRLHMVFRVHTIEELHSLYTAEDIFFPYLLDLLFGAICIYGEGLELQFLENLKNKTLDQVIFETKVAFTNKRNDFLNAYFKEDKYVMVDSIYDYYLLLKNYFITPEIKVEYTIKKPENFEKQNSEELLVLFLNLEKSYKEIDFERIFQFAKIIKFEPGYGRGAILYNLDTKKILILDHSHGGGGWWALPKGGVEPDELNNPEKTVKREIFEETGISDVDLNLELIGETYHTYRKTENFFRKVRTEYYFATTHTQEIKLSDEHLSYKWIDISEINKLIEANNVKYILNKWFFKFGEKE